MASEPLSHTSNCKREAGVGVFWVEQVFFPKKAVFRCWYSQARWPAGRRQRGRVVGILQ